jgi:hypothetical protein
MSRANLHFNKFTVGKLLFVIPANLDNCLKQLLPFIMQMIYGYSGIARREIGGLSLSRRAI